MNQIYWTHRSSPRTGNIPDAAASSSPNSRMDLMKEDEEVSKTVEIVNVQISQLGIFMDADENVVKQNIHRHLLNVLKWKIPTVTEDFGESMEWLNTSKPLTRRNHLKNRIVVMDFFTYCCINCMHIQSFLNTIEERFTPDCGVAVIGVHSAKFTNEKGLKNVKNAVKRNGITHPVVNDPQSFWFEQLHLLCWPSVIIIGPQGHILFTFIGENEMSKLEFVCSEILNFFRMQNYPLNTSPLPIAVKKETVSPYELKYPSNICINTEANFIVVSDTGNHRLLVLTRDYHLLHIIGSGVKGYRDGEFDECSFDMPHGVCYRNDTILYVADTGNHAIRMVNLHSKRVTTAFKPKLVRYKDDPDCEKDNQFPLKSFHSPWDLCIGPQLSVLSGGMRCLYICVAGSHQIWVLYLRDCCDYSPKNPQGIFHKAGDCEVFSGNGAEEHRNNVYKLNAGFAQPSGIMFSKFGYLYICDSESSSIRSISLHDGSVKTVVGGGDDPKDLFVFGDVDGTGKDVRLQHPMGICDSKGNNLFIADSYNHKIKAVNIDLSTSATYSGTGAPGNTITGHMLDLQFNEPHGLCFVDENVTLYVADTNNHCIKVLDLSTKITSVMPILPPRNPIVEPIKLFCNVYSFKLPKTEHDDSEPIQCIPILHGGSVNCKLSLHLADKLEMSSGSPQPWKITVAGHTLSVVCQSNSIFDEYSQPALILKDENPMQNLEQKCESEIFLDVALYFCDKINNTCMSRNAKFKFIVEMSNSGPRYADIDLRCFIK